MSLSLDSQGPRRVGLRRGDLHNTSLHPNIASSKGDAKNSRTSQRAPGMRQGSETRPEVEDELSKEAINAAINAPPKSDESSDEEDPGAANIQNSVFKRGTSEPKLLSLKDQRKSTLDKKAVNGNDRHGTRGTRASTKVTGPASSFDSSSSSNSGARKPTSDAFGQIPQDKKRKFMSSQRYGKSNRPARKNPSKSLPTRSPLEDSPQIRKFKMPEELDCGSSPEPYTSSPRKPAFKKIDTAEFDDPEESATSSPLKAVFKSFISRDLDSPVTSKDDSPLPVAFKTMDAAGFDSPIKGDRSKLLKFKRAGKLDSDPFSDNNEIPLKEAAAPSMPTRRSGPRKVAPPLTQLPAFKTFDIDGELAQKAHGFLRENMDTLRPIPAPIDEDSFTMSQISRCPMCKKPVDPEELKRCGDMNTRQQEKFCRAHQRKDAEENWFSKGYPEINWDTLDTRISQHHAFISKLVNGADSHYRGILSETVKAGKDRNLLKSGANLIPGYYGSRGLQVISENIMHEFTPLLKRRVVKDRLMAARGVTGFVQSVLVPEVAVLLIIEDMSLSANRAREVLNDSVGMGELVNEEVIDVVRRVEDSEEEDNEAYN